MEVLGLLFLVVLWQVADVVGWWPVVWACVALCVGEFLVRRALASRQNFRFLDPLEQALRRASQGFAVMVFAPLLAGGYVWVHGRRGFGALLPLIETYTGKGWPFYLLAAAFVVGLIRFRAGTRRAAGANDDGIRRPLGLLKLAIGLGTVGALTLTYPWGAYGANVAGFYGLVFVYAAGLWCGLVAGMRVLLLSVPMRSAFGMVGTHIRDTEFSWDRGAPRRWWQFSKRRGR